MVNTILHATSAITIFMYFHSTFTSNTLWSWSLVSNNKLISSLFPHNFAIPATQCHIVCIYNTVRLTSSSHIMI